MTIHQNDKDARISIHAPRGGSDNANLDIYFFFVPFQSTLPAGGATAKTTKSLRKTCAGSRKC